MSSHPCLPLLKTFDAARPLRSPGVTPLRRYCEPGRRRLVFSRFPGVAGYTTDLLHQLFRWDEDGFSSCWTCPCHRAAPNHPAGVTDRFGQLTACHAAFAPNERARPPELYFSRPPSGSLPLRPGDLLTVLKTALSIGFIRFVSSADATQATELLTLSLMRLTPTEHVCLFWTHSFAIMQSLGSSRLFRPGV